ncbi:winged helix-turn-helix transcriptional regulator [Bdellovibrio sp. HCB288]|uniref:winged helix-turn-helix transcriptional regulator n=1 Tax=Bdellovibrio sp. HCB288 TaxID=3394355 RepID=UPI0039B3B083
MVTKMGKNKKAPFCPVTKTMQVIGGKWKPMILYNLLSGQKRFNELQRLSGGPSARVLTLQLRELEEDKVIKRHVFDQIPPRVEYSLTPKGKSLGAVLETMAQWGDEN